MLEKVIGKGDILDDLMSVLEDSCGTTLRRREFCDDGASHHNVNSAPLRP